MQRAVTCVATFLCLLASTLAIPVSGNASRCRTIVCVNVITGNNKSWLDNLLGYIQDPVMPSLTTSQLRACGDADVAWCGPGEVELAKPTNVPAGGREVAFVIFASSFIVTIVCAYFSTRSAKKNSLTPAGIAQKEALNQTDTAGT